MRVSHRFTAGSARFDEDNLVSDAGLVPLLGLAEQTGLAEIIAGKVSIATPRIKSGSANLAPKLVGVIAGMCAGADSIDDLDMLRAGGMPILFDGVYAPSTLGTLLREFSFGHARQLESVLREHLCALTARTQVLAGLADQAFIDVDSLLRPVYGHAKQGASYGHTKIAGKQVLRKGLSPLATTISTAHSAPVLAGMRLRAGKTGSGKGAGRMLAQAIATARAAGATGKILVRGDSAFGNRAVVRACRRGNAEFSLVMTKNPAIARAIAAIPDTAWAPVRYPGAVQDPDTGAWISDAEVAEVTYTAFAHTKDRTTARLVIRRVKDARYPDSSAALFPVWSYHPFFTNSTLPTTQADITHRRQAIIETVFADLIDGPLAHLPSGHFGANSAWALCAAIAHNLLHTAGTLAGRPHTRVRGATLRRQLITVPARLARPPAHLCCTSPAAGPGHRHGCNCGNRPSATAHPPPPDTHPDDTRPDAPHLWKSWTDQRLRHASTPPHMIIRKPRSLPQLFRGSRLSGPNDAFPPSPLSMTTAEGGTQPRPAAVLALSERGSGALCVIGSAACRRSCEVGQHQDHPNVISAYFFRI